MQFWLEIAESTPTIIPDSFTISYDTTMHAYVPKKISSASANAAFFGVPKMFVPRWSWLWSSLRTSGSSVGRLSSATDGVANHNKRFNAAKLDLFL
jgi:NTE family protein